MKQYPRFIIGIFCIVILFSKLQANPYGQYPNGFFIPEGNLTTSVILYDFDNDGHLDLMRGIYSYPIYGSADYGSKQKIHWSNSGTLPYSTMSDVCINRLINVDCIAVNDYNSDGFADILFGKVTCESVGDACDELWSYSGDQEFESNIAAWDPELYYDTHAIQWVDYDADGELEIAALNFTSACVHFYDYTPNGEAGSFSSTPDFTLKIDYSRKHKPGFTDDFSEEDLVQFQSPPADLEFGDINGDGYLDMFVNRKYPAVYLNTQNSEAPFSVTIEANAFDAYSDSSWQEIDPVSCGAFGLYYENETPTLALATSSWMFRHLGELLVVGDSTWATPYEAVKVFTCNSSGNLILKECFDNDDPGPQPVVDLMWFDTDGEGHQDLYTAAHCILDTTTIVTRLVNEAILGQHYIYFHDSDSSGLDYQNGWTGEGFLDGGDDPGSHYSTSITVGDIDGDDVASYEEYCILQGSVNKCFFYLPHFPAFKIDSLLAINTGVDSVIVPEACYCCDLQRGWVSVDSTFIDTTIGLAELDIFKIYYHYSLELDVVTGDEWWPLVYLWGDTDADAPTNEPDLSNFTNDFETEYSYPTHGTGYWGMDEDGCIGSVVPGSSENLSSIYYADDYRDLTPDVNVQRICISWSYLQPFIKEFFWGLTDHWINTYLEGGSISNRKIILSLNGTAPMWTMGSAGMIDTLTYGRDACMRPFNEGIVIPLVLSLVNRYKPNGTIFTGANCSGVKIYQFESEPQLKDEGYGDFTLAREAICEKMYWTYQAVKSIDTGFTVISPNISGMDSWAGYMDSLYTMAKGNLGDSAYYKYCDMVGFQCHSAYTESANPLDWTFVDPLDDSCLVTSWTAYNKCLAVDNVMNRNGDTLKSCVVLDYGFIPSLVPNFTAQTITQNGIFFSFPRVVWSIYWWNDNYSDLPAINQLAKTLKGCQMHELQGGSGVSDTLSFNFYEDADDEVAVWHFSYEDDDSSKYVHLLATPTDYGATEDEFQVNLITDATTAEDQHVKLDYLNFNSFERQINVNDQNYNDPAWVTFLPSELDSVPVFMTELVDGDDYDLTIPLPKEQWTMVSFNLYPGSQDISTIFTSVNSDSISIENYQDYHGYRNDGTWSWETQSGLPFNWNMNQGYNIWTNDDTLYMPQITVSDDDWYALNDTIDITPSARRDFYIAYTPCWDMPCSTAFDTLTRWEIQPSGADSVLVWACNSDGLFYVPGADTCQYFSMRQGEGYKLKLTSSTTLNNFQFTQDSVTSGLESLPGKPGGNSSQIASCEPAHFKFRKRTQNAYPVVLVDIDIEGVVPEPGDEIGVFMWDTLCVGAVGYSGGGKTIITAWEDEIMTPDSIDGFGEGETMSFKYWDASDAQEIDLNLSNTISSAHPNPNQIFTASPIFGQNNYARISFSGVNTNLIIPDKFELYQNYPNPFNPTTRIRFDLPEPSQVKLEIFNILGQRVITLKDQIHSAGFKAVEWDGRSSSGVEISSGLYFYRIEVKSLTSNKHYIQSKKMMMLK